MRRRSIATLSLAFLAGCGCNADLAIRVTPTSKQLRVTEQFTPIVSYRGCSDSRPLSDVVHWTSSDTLVATTNFNTGLTTARTPGTAVITGIGMTHPQHVPVPLTVVP